MIDLRAKNMKIPAPWLSRRLCLIAVFLSLVLATGASRSSSRELIVCGWDEVFILDTARNPPVKIWSWKAADRPELPASLRAKFKTTDDCKPVDGGKRILITSSSDGIALVERSSGRVLFYASAGGAHSAEMLPGKRVVVASSTSQSDRGNRLILFDLRKSDQSLFETEFVSGHGVVWDERRKLLWALCGQTLRTYRLAAWNTNRPQLDEAARYDLPDAGGHDLSAVPGSNYLAVTTIRNAWLFDRNSHEFKPHPLLGGVDDVKSINVHPSTGQVVWTQADKGFWWTSTIRFLNPESTFEMKGERLYKARWVAAPR